MSTRRILFWLIVAALFLYHRIVFSWDGAEFAKNVELGVLSHPPGAPIYFAAAFLIHDILHLSGFHTLLLLSFVASAACILFLYGIARGRERTGDGSTAVWLFVFSPIFLLNYLWEEVYMTALAFILCSVYLFLCWYKDGRRRQLILSAVTWGLAVGVYPPSAFIALFYVSYLIFKPKWFIPFFMVAVAVGLLSYAPVFAVKGFAGGLVWVRGVATQTFDTTNPIALAKRAVATAGLYGIVSVAAILAVIRKKKEFTPFFLAALPYAMFLSGGSVHFYEHLLIPVAFLCIPAGNVLKEVNKQYVSAAFIIAVLIAVASVVVIHQMYDIRETQIKTKLEFIKDVPLDSVIIDLAEYEHLNYYVKRDDVYAIGTPEQMGKDGELHTRGGKILWTYQVDSLRRKLMEDKRVFIFNTAFLSPSVEKSLRERYILTEVYSTTMYHNNPVWLILKRPASMAFDRITLYHIKTNPDFTYAADQGCGFTLENTTYVPEFKEFRNMVGCDRGIKVWNKTFCFDECELDTLTCKINWRDDLDCIAEKQGTVYVG